MMKNVELKIIKFLAALDVYSEYLLLVEHKGATGIGEAYQRLIEEWVSNFIMNETFGGWRGIGNQVCPLGCPPNHKFLGFDPSIVVPLVEQILKIFLLHQ